MVSPLLATVYASAPTDQVLIQTLDIEVPGLDPVRVCTGFEDITAVLETAEEVTFLAGNLVIELPEKADTAQQTLRFGLWNVANEAQDIVAAALESDEQVTITYREFLASDLTAPASAVETFTLVGGQFSGVDVQLEASYYDILNTAWPRERYTQLNAPGIRYL